MQLCLQFVITIVLIELSETKELLQVEEVLQTACLQILYTSAHIKDKNMTAVNEKNKISL